MANIVYTCLHKVHQVRAVADDDASAVAGWTSDFIAFAGDGLAIDGPEFVAGHYGAVGSGLGPDGDVIAPHARLVPVDLTKGPTLDDALAGDKSDVSLSAVGPLRLCRSEFARDGRQR